MPWPIVLGYRSPVAKSTAGMTVGVVTSEIAHAGARGDRRDDAGVGAGPAGLAPRAQRADAGSPDPNRRRCAQHPPPPVAIAEGRRSFSSEWVTYTKI